MIATCVLCGSLLADPVAVLAHLRQMHRVEVAADPDPEHYLAESEPVLLLG